MITADRHFEHLLLIAQDALQFQHALARHDHLLARFAPFRQIHLAQCQTMAVSRDRSQRFRRRFQQKPVQVITDVLLRHREMRLLEQPLEVLLRQLQRLLRVDFLDRRELSRRQRRQREATLARPHRHPFAVEVERHLDAFRQRAADVEQLATRDRDFAVALHVHFGRCDQLDFEVRGRHRQPAALRRQQHVREDRHRLPAFHDADDGLQRAQDGFALGNDLHRDVSGRVLLISILLIFSITIVSSTAQACAERLFPQRSADSCRQYNPCKDNDRRSTCRQPVDEMCTAFPPPVVHSFAHINPRAFSTGSGNPRSCASATRAVP